MIAKEKIAEIIREETWFEVDGAFVYGIEEAAEKILQAIKQACEHKHRVLRAQTGTYYCDNCGVELSR